MSSSNFIKQPSDFKAEKSIAGLYDLGDPIGEGNFSVVKEAKHVFTGERVAVKIINKEKIPPFQRDTITQEARCMQLVQHPYIVRLLEVFDTPTKLYLIMECADGGDLHEYMAKQSPQKGLSESLAKRFFAQIVQAVAYCHQMHVVHRDLKPENVVVFKKQNVVKLIDFGFSRKFEPGVPLNHACGSLAYSAPEIFVKEAYDPVPADVWSLGVILYWIVCGKSPFAGANDSETLTKILDCKYKSPPLSVSADCRQLISLLLRKQPKDRPVLKDILNHRWLRDELSESSCESLLTKDCISPSDHAQIVNIMVEGNVATRSDVLASLEQRKNNHITATYFLLAGRICQKPPNSGLDAEPDVKRQTLRNKPEQSTISQTRSDSNLCLGKSVHRAFSIIQEESFTSMSLETHPLKCMSRSQSFVDATELSEQLHASQSFSGVPPAVLSPTLRRKASSEIKSKPSGVVRNPLLQLKEDTDESEIQSDAHKILHDDYLCAKTGTCKIGKKWETPKRFAPSDKVNLARQKPQELHIEASEVEQNTDKDLTGDVPVPEKQDENVEVSDTQRLQPDEKDGRSAQKQRRFRTKIAPFFIDVVRSSDVCNCCNGKPPCTCCIIQ